MMRRWVFFLAAGVVGTVIGCAKPEPEAPAPPIPQPKAASGSPGQPRATMSDKELSINPNGTMATPGSKLGGR